MYLGVWQGSGSVHILNKIGTQSQEVPQSRSWFFGVCANSKNKKCRKHILTIIIIIIQKVCKMFFRFKPKRNCQLTMNNFFFLKNVLNTIIYQNWVLWVPCQGACLGAQHLAQMAYSRWSLNTFMSESENTKYLRFQGNNINLPSGCRFRNPTFKLDCKNRYLCSGLVHRAFGNLTFYVLTVVPALIMQSGGEGTLSYEPKYFGPSPRTQHLDSLKIRSAVCKTGGCTCLPSRAGVLEGSNLIEYSRVILHCTKHEANMMN